MAEATLPVNLSGLKREPELPQDLQQQYAAWQEEFGKSKRKELIDAEFLSLAREILQLWSEIVREHGNVRWMRYEGPIPISFVDRFNKYLLDQGFRAQFRYTKLPSICDVDINIEKKMQW